MRFNTTHEIKLNQIPEKPQESFDGLSSLKQLMIDRNRVEEIQPGAFSQLGFLNLLSLTHNQLVYIPNMAFQVCSQNHLSKF